LQVSADNRQRKVVFLCRGAWVRDAWREIVDAEDTRDFTSAEHGLAQRDWESLGRSEAVISCYLGRARMAGLSWPVPDNLDDQRLEVLLFPPAERMASSPASFLNRQNHQIT
jgi:hypothetical protein